MLKLIFHTPVPAKKWSFLVHSTKRNAPYIHPSHDLILELWQTFSECLSSITLAIDGVTSF